MLKCELKKEELVLLLIKQLENFFYLNSSEVDFLNEYFSRVWRNLYNCMKGIDNKYFTAKEGCFFNPYHSGQYLIYLYYYSYVLSESNNKVLADKLYYLNKIMHSCDIFHEVLLPEVFFLEHPVGTVLGRAKYGSGFFAMQNCTIGGNKKVYPRIGINLKMYSGSKILGNCTIGDNVIISANTYIKDTDIPDNSMVFGSSPNLIIKKYEFKK